MKETLWNAKDIIMDKKWEFKLMWTFRKEKYFSLKKSRICLKSHCLKRFAKKWLFEWFSNALKSPLRKISACVSLLWCLDVDQTFWQGTFHVCLCKYHFCISSNVHTSKLLFLHGIFQLCYHIFSFIFPNLNSITQPNNLNSRS